MKQIMKNTAILLLITAIAAVGLSYVYELTKEPIALAEQEAAAAAYRAVYAEAATFEPIDNDKAVVASYNNTLPAGTFIEQVLVATAADGTRLGYVFTAVSSGYGGEVAIALGIDSTATVVGYDVLRHSETPGFGAKAEDADVAAQFPGITAADQLDGITGATYTTNALKNATGAAIDFVKEMGGAAQ